MHVIVSPRVSHGTKFGTFEAVVHLSSSNSEHEVFELNQYTLCVLIRMINR